MKRVKVKEAKPCGYHVLVELHGLYDMSNGERKSEGGIILHGNTAQREQDSIHIGKVVSVGEHAHKFLSCYGLDENGNVKEGGHKAWGYDIGDYISFSSHSGQKVSGDPEDMRRLLTDHEILMKVEIEEE